MKQFLNVVYGTEEANVPTRLSYKVVRVPDLNGNLNEFETGPARRIDTIRDTVGFRQIDYRKIRTTEAPVAVGGSRLHLFTVSLQRDANHPTPPSPTACRGPATGSTTPFSAPLDPGSWSRTASGPCC